MARETNYERAYNRFEDFMRIADEVRDQIDKTDQALYDMVITGFEALVLSLLAIAERPR